MTTTQSSGPDGAEERHRELVQVIGEALLGVAPEGFLRVDLVVRISVAARDLTATAYLADGRSLGLAVPEGVADAFAELRQLVHVPGRGTWFSARCAVNAPAEIHVGYNFDHDPKWDPEVPAAHHARDLEAFPRDEAYLPDWLRDRLAQAHDEEQRA
ncbi:hypothetical protein KCV87_23495 [Actinosynnema pretiosum subsp. pretiosum]|uniref:Uncharacterized protein n=2 Tax=Actinosynnema TaxID=40566 RepID=C6WLR2_ACTMD|nr:hypothetical protein [Actinosynnema mirum]ACU40297.1 hypothetical protein Amir_6496 [Actinosynnema mirum DSM 43827]AXX33809.1 hypothetical protein APASM_6444 [Actinosynnema pretiosum subsp. pretiosum]QUF02427.1 hypothetical protein KCV87_23495 [Actinosynnema pretiosum subsp. pretiosum]